ncbi:MAG: hypothetical protein HY22_01915 [[Candidatus Thermochlorobacteriaceae] bacterium GBChlB]|nr:MAG: hypothetical protein HY22_01915 [[Candidatus Thermochlorobacteriaceae] bacterium GBChlB]
MPQSLSWILIYAFAIPIFLILVWVLYKFLSFKLQQDNMTIEPISAMYSDNIVGLSKEELEKKKAEQQAALKQLDEAMRKVPVELVDGKFVPISGEKLREHLARERAKTALEQSANDRQNQELIQIQLPVVNPNPKTETAQNDEPRTNSDSSSQTV